MLTQQTYLILRPSATVYDGVLPARRHVRDATTGIVLTLVLTFALPAQLVVPALTTLGRPGVMLGMALMIWWTLTRLHPTLPTRGRQPLRWALAAYLVTLGLSYVAAQIRGLPALEENSAGRTILMAFAGAGVLLATADGVLTRERIDTVLRALSASTAVMALVALGQNLTQTDLTQYLRLPPLLQFHHDVVGFADRGAGFFRVAGTAGHFIEFSVLMVLGLLVSMHLARFSPTRRQRQIYGACGAVQALVIPIALSRTGVIALALGIGLFFLIWPLRTSFNVLVIGAAIAVLAQAANPGILGTLRSLLFAGSNDPSVQGRLDDYAYVEPFIRESPWLGRGPGTFIPEHYQLLDNQWLLTLVTTGVVGVVGMAVLLGSGIVLAWRLRRFTSDARDRDLAAVLAVGLIVAAAATFTFDSFFFSTFLITVHVFIGLTGALWRVTRAERLNLSGLEQQRT